MRFRTFFCVLSFAAATSAIAQKPEEVAYFHLNRLNNVGRERLYEMPDERLLLRVVLFPRDRL